MFPIILILIFISLSFAYYFNQKAKIRREQRHDRYLEKQQELVDRLRAKEREGE
jgi:hypothetical protein